MIIEPPSLTELFGAGAQQNAETLTFQKATLPTLTPKADNSGQQLFAALLLAVLSRQRAITTPTGEILSAPGAGGKLTFPIEQSRIRGELWRIIPYAAREEYVYELNIWS